MSVNVGIPEVRLFWDQRPCNVRHSAEPVGTRRYFEEVTRRRYLVEPHILPFMELGRWRGKRVLELGCGIGTDSEQFSRAGALVTAVDLSGESARIARQRFRALGLRGDVLQANIEQLSQFTTPRPFDLIYSFGVLHHTPHPDSALWEISNLFSRPGTVLKAMLYHRRSLKVLGALLRGDPRFWFQNIDELVRRESEAQQNCPITRTYTRRAARQLIEEHGFRVTDLRVRHIFPYRVDDYVRGELVRRWPFKFQPATNLLARMLGWHICLTATKA